MTGKTNWHLLQVKMCRLSNYFLNKNFTLICCKSPIIAEECCEKFVLNFWGNNFGGIITAPPAIFESLRNRRTAGGFRTFSNFHGFGHGDSLVVSRIWMVFSTGLGFYWFFKGLKKRKKLTDIGF
jgi:hypothetical protein